MSEFIARNKKDWEELQRLLERSRRSTKRLTSEEIHRLDVLYRRTSVHLAQVTTRTRDRQMINFLNDLTAAAHSVIYLPPRKSMWRGVGTFIVEGFARSMARTWRYHCVSALLLSLGGLLAYFAASRDLLAAYALLPAGDVRTPGSTQEQLMAVLRSGRDQQGGEKFLFASFLFSHNLKVGLLAMGVGVLAGIPTVLLMVYNGMILGAFASLHHNAGIYSEFWAWILPHGVTEIGAIVLCGGVGLMLGDAVVRPGLLTRSEKLRLAGIEAAQVCIGITAMLCFAAVIESYLRQSHLDDVARLAFAAATAVFWAGYIFHGFFREKWDAQSEVSEADASIEEHRTVTKG
ncbi:MAG: stage II sporulation protein M [Planctomycetota bacterium]